jgi:hypothetical protein
MLVGRASLYAAAIACVAAARDASHPAAFAVARAVHAAGLAPFATRPEQHSALGSFSSLGLSRGGTVCDRIAV